ncbi:MAG TPA: hypothetical protein VFE62_08535, partial [Gemmataceae bacterium]|nr:hypothetical protein [Gemmataceae bacterium]
MAVKFDKEMILKHRFWIMLGVSVVLVLTGITILALSESDLPQKLAGELKQNVPVTDNDKTIKVWQDAAGNLRGQEANVWRNAYEAQAPDFKFADDVERKFNFYDGYFANDIKIGKLTDKKTWPADTDFLIHGVFLRQEGDWVEIQARGVPVKEEKGKEPAKTPNNEKVAAKEKTPAKDAKSVIQDKTPAKGVTLDKTPAKGIIQDKTPAKGLIQEKTSAKDAKTVTKEKTGVKTDNGIKKVDGKTSEK